jgi:hypothetical protein
MTEIDREVAPGPDATWFRTKTELLRIPPGWVLLPPGDAMLTRRVKAAGPTWVVREKRGNKVFSRGVCAPKDRIERIRQEVAQERADPAYQQRLQAGRSRRAEEQQEYVGEFRAAVLAFLGFAPPHQELAEQVADAISRHATPVGSGTVARTQRIPIAERAASATIAWLRHQTTAYDSMHIARVRGRRREVRRELAQVSRALLACYRRGDAVAPDLCPLRAALARIE